MTALAPARPQPQGLGPAALESPDLLDFEDCFPSLAYLGRRERGAVRRLKAAFREARAFSKTHVRPLALAGDAALQQDPTAPPRALLELALAHRRFSRLVPGILGGLGESSLAAPIVAAEETAAVDPGFVGLTSGHGLGMAAIAFSCNLRILDYFAEQTVKGESGEAEPFLIDCAITEPTAGTDAEETQLLPKATLMSEARRVPGGAVLNGRKCFISGGQYATHHLILLPFDRRDPVRTMAMFLVPTGSKGFSVGPPDQKMGQKSGPAVELAFEECFVPEDRIVIDGEALGREIAEMLLNAVLGYTRIYVGAWATGIGRGAFETALAFAKTHSHRGRRVIEHQWAQECLTNMLMNVHKARATYVEAMLAFIDANGGRIGAPAFVSSPWFQAVRRSRPVRRVLLSETLRKVVVRKRACFRGRVEQRIQFYSSLAKVACSDLAMETCHLALEMMGAAGVRHGAGAEKLLRDAKLCQIFEGTNQLNRLHMFKHFVARDVPGLSVF